MGRCLHLNAVGSFVYANGTESCTIDSLATGRPRLLDRSEGWAFDEESHPACVGTVTW